MFQGLIREICIEISCIELCMILTFFLFSVQFHISAYEDSVAAHLTKILNSEQHSVILSSAK